MARLPAWLIYLTSLGSCLVSVVLTLLIPDPTVRTQLQRECVMLALWVEISAILFVLGSRLGRTVTDRCLIWLCSLVTLIGVMLLTGIEPSQAALVSWLWVIGLGLVGFVIASALWPRAVKRYLWDPLMEWISNHEDQLVGPLLYLAVLAGIGFVATGFIGGGSRWLCWRLGIGQWECEPEVFRVFDP